MESAPFDDVWDKLYRAYEVNWYVTPSDARDVARRLFESNADYILKLGISTYWATSGCIKIEFTNTNGNVDCEIGWVCCHFGRNV